MKFLIQPPQLLRNYYRGSIWRMKKTEPIIYLTFDDGPVPELTPWILDVLKKHNIKATFFCVGENVISHPTIFQRILQEGHQVGNHSYNHLKGWKTSKTDYLKNIEKCEILTKTKLFRPPYGRIKKSQFLDLKNNYKVVFWDVLSYDYDTITSPTQCLKNCIRYTRNGSIIVFHDNIKAEDKLKFVLPQYIEYFLELNFKFSTLS